MVTAPTSTTSMATTRKTNGVRTTHIQQSSIRRAINLARGAAVAVLLATFLVGTPALAHDHDVDEVGSPVRVAAYLLYPIGFALDWLIFRPAHWLVSFEPIQSIVGHEHDDDDFAR